jgi:hypothetical protein
VEWAGWSEQSSPDLAEKSPLELDGTSDSGRIIIAIGLTEDRHRMGYDHLVHKHWIPEWTK